MKRTERLARTLRADIGQADCDLADAFHRYLDLSAQLGPTPLGEPTEGDRLLLLSLEVAANAQDGRRQPLAQVLLARSPELDLRHGIFWRAGQAYAFFYFSSSARGLMARVDSFTTSTIARFSAVAGPVMAPTLRR